MFGCYVADGETKSGGGGQLSFGKVDWLGGFGREIVGGKAR